LIFHKECQYFERGHPVIISHCAIQAFEAFLALLRISGEISSKECRGTLLRLLRIWRCRATTFEPREKLH
jgi:hypothetical protein